MDYKSKAAPTSLKVEITQEVAKGNYSNFAIISHTPSEFVLDFAAIYPNREVADVMTRVVMTPDNVVKLMDALQDNIARYVSQFGDIVMPEQKQKSVPPFSNHSGEA